MCACTTTLWMWSSEGNVWKLLLSFYMWTQVIRLCGKHPYPLSHLTWRIQFKDERKDDLFSVQPIDWVWMWGTHILSFLFYAWFSMLLFMFHAASPWLLPGFNSKCGLSLCQLTAFHLKCLPCLSAFLSSLLGKKQADCPGSGGKFLSLLFSRRTKSVSE